MILTRDERDQLYADRDKLQRMVNDAHLKLFRLSAEWGMCKDENRRREIQDERGYVIKWLRRDEERLNETMHRLRLDAKAQLEKEYRGAPHSPAHDGL